MLLNAGIRGKVCPRPFRVAWAAALLALATGWPVLLPAEEVPLDSVATFVAFTPAAVAMDPVSGDRFISDSLQHRIFRIDAAMNVVSSFDTIPLGFSSPTGLALGPSGASLFVSDNLVREVFEITVDGVLLDSISISPLKRKPPSQPPTDDPRGVA